MVRGNPGERDDLSGGHDHRPDSRDPQHDVQVFATPQQIHGDVEDGNRFDELLDACESFAASRGLTIEAGVNLARVDAFRRMRARGYRERSLWGPADWNWIQQQGILRPAFWTSDERLETMFDEIPLPLLRMTYGEGLTRKQREVLAFLVKNREKSFSETALARALGVHKATMNHHLRKLESMGTIERQADPTDGRRLVIVPAPGIELLLG